MAKIGFISLGCPKNLVDSEVMIGLLQAQGHVLTNYHVADDADYYRCFLTDGTTLEAKCVGLDALTDLAYVEIVAIACTVAAVPLPAAGSSTAPPGSGDPGA